MSAPRIVPRFGFWLCAGCYCLVLIGFGFAAVGAQGWALLSIWAGAACAVLAMRYE